MNNLLKICSILLLLTLLSCEKDDNGEEENDPNPISGKITATIENMDFESNYVDISVIPPYAKVLLGGRNNGESITLYFKQISEASFDVSDKSAWAVYTSTDLQKFEGTTGTITIDKYDEVNNKITGNFSFTGTFMSGDFPTIDIKSRTFTDTDINK